MLASSFSSSGFSIYRSRSSTAIGFGCISRLGYISKIYAHKLRPLSLSIFPKTLSFLFLPFVRFHHILLHSQSSLLFLKFAVKIEAFWEMGKYIRKGKITGGAGGVAVMEVHHQPTSYLGVRTRSRAKTLAAAAIQQTLTPNSTNSSSSSSNSNPSSCYLQLRSRRLQKSPIPKTPKPNPSLSAGGNKRSEGSKKEENEASFGENILEVEGKSSRNSRETTPCSQVKRDSETVGTPGSTTRPTTRAVTNRRIQSPTPANLATPREMEEFFAVREQRQQREFAEKYNFDPVKDCPCPGRYEWVKL